MPEMKNVKLSILYYVLNIEMMLRSWFFLVNCLIYYKLWKLVNKIKNENEEKCIEKNLSMIVIPEFQRMFSEVKKMFSKELYL